MVKKFKVLLAVVMSVALIASSSFCALAEEEYDPSVNDYNVMLNGDYVEFTDAAPVNVEGRIMVPFRVILETLGATVDWDGASKTVTAVLDDTTITFVVGQSDINIDKAGEKSVKKMDVVPYINPANNRTYVSTRFVAESFGYNVGWDSDNATAIIIDYDTVFGNAAKDFSKMDAFMQSTKTDMNTAYESVLSAAVEFSIYKEIINAAAGSNIFKDDLNVKIDLEGDAVSKGTEMSIDMNLGMNLNELIKSLPADMAGEISAEDQAMLDSLSDLDMSVYADIESGDVLFTTNVNSMLDPEAGDSTWFKIDLNGIYEALGIDIEPLLNISLSEGIYTMEGVFDMIADMYDNAMTISTYDEMAYAYDVVNALIGDNALKVSKSGNTTKYTADFSGIADYIEYDGIKGKLVMTDRQNGNYDCTIDLTMDIEGLAKLSIKLDGSYDKTSKNVEKVPSGAQVIDISSNITDVL